MSLYLAGPPDLLCKMGQACETARHPDEGIRDRELAGKRDVLRSALDRVAAFARREFELRAVSGFANRTKAVEAERSS